MIKFFNRRKISCTVYDKGGLVLIHNNPDVIEKWYDEKGRIERISKVDSISTFKYYDGFVLKMYKGRISSKNDYISIHDIKKNVVCRDYFDGRVYLWLYDANRKPIYHSRYRDDMMYFESHIDRDDKGQPIYYKNNDISKINNNIISKFSVPLYRDLIYRVYYNRFPTYN